MCAFLCSTDVFKCSGSLEKKIIFFFLKHGQSQRNLIFNLIFHIFGHSIRTPFPENSSIQEIIHLVRTQNVPKN